MVDFQKRDTRRGLEPDPAEDEDEWAAADHDERSEPTTQPNAAELAARAAAEQAERRDGQAEERHGQAEERDGRAEERDGRAEERDGQDPVSNSEGDGEDSVAGQPASDHDPAGGGHHDGVDGHDDHRHDGHDDHGHHVHDVDSLGIAVVTVSSTRSLADDPAGDAIVESLDGDGHEVVTRELIGDDHDAIQRSVNALAAREDVDVVVTTGGTGVTPDDVTPEAVAPLFDKTLPGFGELFRALSREDIGSRVVATRAVGGVVDGVPVFCLPGSEAAVSLGVEGIILHEAPHLAGLSRRDERDADGH